jgi:predicted DNA binding CopG/RHH family protein
MEATMDKIEDEPKVKNLEWYAENQVLDEEEQQIADDMAAGLYVSTKSRADVNAEWKRDLEYTKRKKPITVRVQADDISLLKDLAKKVGIPYQTLVSSIIHRYVTGQLKGDA